jgi:tetratricopeptide (TPR) repeat protein
MATERDYTLYSMSVLFEALQKAAHDYRAQKAPIIVPLTHVSSPWSIGARPRLRVVLLTFLLMSSGVGAWLYFMPSQDKEQDLTPKTDGVMSLRSAKPTENEVSKEGISLPAESLKPDAELDADTEAVASSIADLAVVSGRASSFQHEQEQGRSNTGIVVTRAPSRLSVALDRARQAEEEQQWTEALAYYNKALLIDAENIDAQQGKVYALGQRAYPRDIARLKEIAAENPDSAPINIALAHSMAKREQFKEALAYWQQALALDPENGDYQTGLGILYDKMGKHEQAIKAYRAVQSPLPEPVRQRLAFLQTLLERQRHAEAESGEGE